MNRIPGDGVGGAKEAGVVKESGRRMYKLKKALIHEDWHSHGALIQLNFMSMGLLKVPSC